MPPSQAPAAVPTQEGRPVRLLLGSSFSIGLSVSYTVGYQSAFVVVTGIDVTVEGGAGPQLQFRAGVTATGGASGDFYYDSQSIGEGLGVWFSWRGALPLYQGDSLLLNGGGSGSIAWGYHAWGFVIPGRA